MASTQLLLALFLTSLFAISAAISPASSPSQSPAASADCWSLILNMADCLSYVSNGSTDVKPVASCCSGLKTVLKANPDCLCKAFKSSSQFGIVLNVTKAVGLPAACGVAAPSIATCALSPAGDSPVGSPASTPMPFSSAPSPNDETNEQAPTPAKSGVAVLSASAASLVLTLVIASLSTM